MAVLLGYTTALKYWRSCAHVTYASAHEQLLGSSIERRNATNSLQTQLSKKRAKKHCSAYSLEHPGAHLITLCQQFASPYGISHALTKLPSSSCIKSRGSFHEDDVFVSTPEFCFLQMASVLTLEELIALGFELCGSYVRTEDATLYQVLPLTSVKKLRSFITKTESFHGIKKARRACRYILPNSASPMETALTLLLCLPYSLGGFGIRAPELNYPIELPGPMKKKLRTRYYVCDLFWPSVNLAIEYDSDLAHAGIYKTAKDALRRSILTTLGISVLSVTRPQIMDRTAFFQLAYLVAKKTNKRIRYEQSSFISKHQKLRKTLFS